jgi:hypothetical protein
MFVPLPGSIAACHNCWAGTPGGIRSPLPKSCLFEFLEVISRGIPMDVQLVQAVVGLLGRISMVQRWSTSQFTEL